MLVQTPERSSRRYAWVPADPRIKAPPLTFDRADAAEFDVAYDALARYFQPRAFIADFPLAPAARAVMACNGLYPAGPTLPTQRGRQA